MMSFSDNRPCPLQDGNFLEREEYTYRVKWQPWQDKAIIQNVLMLSDAVYRKNPHLYIKDRADILSISEVVAVGNFKDGDQCQDCIIAVEDDPDTTDRGTLYVVFKGSDHPDDWKCNLDFTMVETNKFLGQFHQGFANRLGLIDFESI